MCDKFMHLSCMTAAENLLPSPFPVPFPGTLYAPNLRAPKIKLQGLAVSFIFCASLSAFIISLEVDLKQVFQRYMLI